ncbi:hypothetical protein IAQ61_009004, partial [Plenodomus lingam]|uniref:uncharacterized protein n=1 Tax=Leptosphaeria maculans TaxID=5022 RepID=UPI00331FC605
FCCHGCQNRGIVDLDCSHMQASGSSRTEHVLAHWNCSEPRANGPVARRRHYVGKATVASIAYVQHSVTQTAGGSFALLRGGAATLQLNTTIVHAMYGTGAVYPLHLDEFSSSVRKLARVIRYQSLSE